jgi:hypothetical protein
MKRKTIISITIIAIISGIHYYAFLIKNFATNVAQTYDDDTQELIYKTSILKSEGPFSIAMVLGAIIISFFIYSFLPKGKLVINILLSLGLFILITIGSLLFYKHYFTFS